MISGYIVSSGILGIHLLCISTNEAVPRWMSGAQSLCRDNTAVLFWEFHNHRSWLLAYDELCRIMQRQSATTNMYNFKNIFRFSNIIWTKKVNEHANVTPFLLKLKNIIK